MSSRFGQTTSLHPPTYALPISHFDADQSTCRAFFSTYRSIFQLRSRLLFHLSHLLFVHALDQLHNPNTTLALRYEVAPEEDDKFDKTTLIEAWKELATGPCDWSKATLSDHEALEGKDICAGLCSTQLASASPRALLEDVYLANGSPVWLTCPTLPRSTLLLSSVRFPLLSRARTWMRVFRWRARF